MSDHGHDEGTGIGSIVGVITLCVIGICVIVALLLPKETTQYFLDLNTRVVDFFDSPFFVGARFISGVLTVGLSGLATWLFFRLLEMEKEHEEHVYHHAHHEVEHIHEEVVHQNKHHEEPLVKNETILTQDMIMKEAENDAFTPDVLQKSSIKSVKGEIEKIEDIHKSVSGASRLPGESSVRGSQIGEKHPGHFQWQSVLRLATSENPSDWKLAIIEADVILDMMTYMQGFSGNTLGERLKNADTGSFQTLKYARAAHHLRNQIAHEPNIELTPRDINQTIRMYESVLNEFKYI